MWLNKPLKPEAATIPVDFHPPTVGQKSKVIVRYLTSASGLGSPVAANVMGRFLERVFSINIHVCVYNTVYL